YSVIPISLSILFLFLLILRVLIPTLFPYTTLFRSYTANRGRYASRTVVSTVRAFPICHRRVSPTVAAHTVAPTEGSTSNNQKTGDRKSTRLNSSHVSISYAVFCLTNNTRT